MRFDTRFASRSSCGCPKPRMACGFTTVRTFSQVLPRGPLSQLRLESLNPLNGPWGPGRFLSHLKAELKEPRPTLLWAQSPQSRSAYSVLVQVLLEDTWQRVRPSLRDARPPDGLEFVTVFMSRIVDRLSSEKRAHMKKRRSESRGSCFGNVVPALHAPRYAPSGSEHGGLLES